MPHAYVVKAVSDDVPTYSIPGVFESLARGKARIGWSFEDGLDLRSLASKAEAGKPFNRKEEDAWRCIGFLNRVECGDYLFYPHQPEYGLVAIAQVDKKNGHYQFGAESDALDGDFRSYRKCCLLTKEALNWRDPIVPPALKRKLGLQGRFYQLYDEDLVESVIEHLDEAGAEAVAGFESRFERIRSVLSAGLPQLIQREFPRQDLTGLCDELFTRMGYPVAVHEGPSERGADLLVTVTSPLFAQEFTVGVQVFSYEGAVLPEDLQVKLDQLLSGWKENGLDYGVLLTTGSCGKSGADLIEHHNHKRPTRPVVLIEGTGLAQLFLRHLAGD